MNLAQQILSVVGILAGVIVGALINHFLEKDRTKHSLLLNKKIEIYSNILIELNTDFQAHEASLGLDVSSRHKMRIKMYKTLSEWKVVQVME